MVKQLLTWLTLGSLVFAANSDVRFPNDNAYFGKKAAGNKQIIFENAAGSSNPRMRWNNTSSKLEFSNDGSLFSAFGSGSGGSAKNYIANPDFESGTNGWATYADAAGSTPVDGTGGSPTTTLAASSSSPLRDLKSGLETKDAANRQGEGISYAFTIDSADQAKVLNISFDYNASSAMVVGSSGDVSVWVYDLTNAVLIPVSPYQLQGNGATNFKFTGVFQTASNSTSYRLILHTATTNASAWTLKIDNVVLGPQVQLYGAPIGDWTAYTPTFTGFGSPTAITAYYRRVGDSLHVAGIFTAGTNTAVGAQLSLPAGMAIDATKIQASANNTTSQIVGTYNQEAANNAGPLIAATTTSTTVVMFGGQYIGSSQLIQINANTFFNNGTAISFQFTVPIAGWSSTVLMSNDTDTRVVAARYSGVGTQTVSSTTPTVETIYTSKLIDTHSAFDTSAHTFTVPVSGLYKVTVGGATSAYTGVVNTTGLYMDLYKNGSQYSTIAIVPFSETTANVQRVARGSDLVQCVAGDLLKIMVYKDSSANNSTFGGGPGGPPEMLSFERLSGPSAIAATEKVYLQYTGNAGTSLTGATTNIDFSTKVVDSHGAWNGTVFTAPKSGFYTAQGSASFSAGGSQIINLYKNGTLALEASNNGGVSFSSNNFNSSIYLLAGDTISVRVDINKTLSNSVPAHWLSISSQ